MNFPQDLPRHLCGLYIEHNTHKNTHETVAQRVAQGDDDHWVSSEERQQAIDTDEVWSIQWYPNTPIGFYRLQASSWAAIETALATMTFD